MLSNLIYSLRLVKWQHWNLGLSLITHKHWTSRTIQIVLIHFYLQVQKNKIGKTVVNTSGNPLKEKKRSTLCEMCSQTREGGDRSYFLLHMGLENKLLRWLPGVEMLTIGIGWLLTNTRRHLLDTLLTAFLSPVIPHREADIWIGGGRKLLPLPDSESPCLAVHLFLS